MGFASTSSLSPEKPNRRVASTFFPTPTKPNNPKKPNKGLASISFLSRQNPTGGLKTPPLFVWFFAIIPNKTKQFVFCYSLLVRR